MRPERGVTNRNGEKGGLNMGPSYNEWEYIQMDANRNDPEIIDVRRLRSAEWKETDSKCAVCGEVIYWRSNSLRRATEFACFECQSFHGLSFPDFSWRFPREEGIPR